VLAVNLGLALFALTALVLIAVQKTARGEAT
jgi:hypothetical protein